MSNSTDHLKQPTSDPPSPVPQPSTAPQTLTPHTNQHNIQSLCLLISDRTRFLRYLRDKGRFLAARTIQKVARGFLTRKHLVNFKYQIGIRLRELLNSPKVRAQEPQGANCADKTGKHGTEQKIDVLFGPDRDSRVKDSEGDTVGVFSTNRQTSKNFGSENSRLNARKNRVISGSLICFLHFFYFACLQYGSYF